MALRKFKEANELCRTCLQVLSDNVLESTKHDIFLTPGIVKKLVLCTSLTIEQQDGYPEFLCDCCYVKVIEFHQFQKMCVESAQRFQELLQSFKAHAEVVLTEGEQHTCSSDIIVPKKEINTEEYNPVQIEKIDCNEIEHQETNLETYTISIISPDDAENSEEGILIKNDKEENSALDKLPSCETHSEVELNEREQIISGLIVPKMEITIEETNVLLQSEYNPVQIEMKECNKIDYQQTSLETYSISLSSPEDDNNIDLVEVPLTKLGKQEVSQKSKIKLENLTAHIINDSDLPEQHATIKNFVCYRCGLRKATKKELMAHIKSHKFERRWPCQFCTQIFARSNCLKRHILTVHEKVRNFACRYCERKFGTKITLKYHEMIHTGEKPHQCNECSHVFPTKSNLNRHLRNVHSADKTYECIQCGKYFSQQKCLKTHEKSHQQQHQPLTKITMDVSSSSISSHIASAAKKNKTKLLENILNDRENQLTVRVPTRCYQKKNPTNNDKKNT